MFLSQITQALNENNSYDVIIDDQEVAEAVVDLYRAKQLAKLAKELEAHSKEVLERRLVKLNIREAHCGDRSIKINDITKKYFDQHKFKLNNPTMYNEYISTTNYTEYRVNVKE